MERAEAARILAETLEAEAAARKRSSGTLLGVGAGGRLRVRLDNGKILEFSRSSGTAAIRPGMRVLISNDVVELGNRAKESGQATLAGLRLLSATKLPQSRRRSVNGTKKSFSFTVGSCVRQVISSRQDPPVGTPPFQSFPIAIDRQKVVCGNLSQSVELEWPTGYTPIVFPIGGVRCVVVYPGIPGEYSTITPGTSFVPEGFTGTKAFYVDYESVREITTTFFQSYYELNRVYQALTPGDFLTSQAVVPLRSPNLFFQAGVFGFDVTSIPGAGQFGYDYETFRDAIDLFTGGEVLDFVALSEPVTGDSRNLGGLTVTPSFNGRGYRWTGPLPTPALQSAPKPLLNSSKWERVQVIQPTPVSIPTEYRSTSAEVYHFWDWGYPDGCRDTLIAMGFDPAGLEPLPPP